jgi:hypothetical protein
LHNIIPVNTLAATVAGFLRPVPSRALNRQSRNGAVRDVVASRDLAHWLTATVAAANRLAFLVVGQFQDPGLAGGAHGHAQPRPAPGQALTLHYDRMMLLLDPTPLTRALAGKKVEVVNYPDGRFAVQFNGTTLGFRVFDKIQTVPPGAIVDNKRLSAVLEQIKAQQAAYPARQQRGHVARRRPPNNLEAPGLPSKGRAPRRGAAAAAA